MNYKIAWSSPVLKRNLYLEFGEYSIWIYCNDLGVIPKSELNKQYLGLVNREYSREGAKIYKYCIDNYEKILQEVKNFLVKEML